MSTQTRVPSRGPIDRLHRLWREPLGRIVVLLGLIVTVLLVGLISFAVLWFMPSRTTESTDDLLLYPADLPDDPLVSSGDVHSSPSVPTVVAFNEFEYPVQPVMVSEDGTFTWPRDPDRAFWIYGTVINYALGLEATSENTTALYSIRPGDQVTMNLGNGGRLEFVVTETGRHARMDDTVFAQTQPGLTLFLAGGVVAERMVVRAEPVVNVAGGMATDLGFTQSNADLAITLTNVEVVPVPGDLPAGWSYLLVNFEVGNSTGLPLDLSHAFQTLTDSAGRTYTPSAQPIPHADGSTVPLSLGAGETARATNAFLLPAEVTGPNLIWRFHPDGSDGLAFAFVYAPMASELSIEVTSAVASETATDLIINGLVFNQSEVTAVLVESNFHLLTNAGESVTLRFADPALPLRAADGQVTYFTLTYVMPASDMATFHVLGHQFKIGPID